MMHNGNGVFSNFLTRLKSNSVYFETDVDLSKLSNTRTGGFVKAIVYPVNATELQLVLTSAKEQLIETQVLGDMTNVAIASGELDFVVISMTKYAPQISIDVNTNIVSCGAGVKMKDLSVWAYDHSLSGFQWMEGIPGTVGAGAFMNAGFLPGQDFQNFLVDAQVLMPDNTIRTMTNREFEYGYRHSSIQKNGAIVLSIRLLIRRGKRWKIWIRMHQYHTRRAKHQPLTLPSAGTVFVPPMPFHVGGILPKLGLVGYKIGGAQISELSPGFIVGVDHMTGEDYYNLVKFIQKSVWDSEHIKLEPEVRLLGFDEGKFDATK